MSSPLVKAEQNSSIRIDDLPEVVMRRRCLRQTEQRLVPVAARRHISHRYDRPGTPHVLLKLPSNEFPLRNLSVLCISAV